MSDKMLGSRLSMAIKYNTDRYNFTWLSYFEKVIVRYLYKYGVIHENKAEQRHLINAACIRLTQKIEGIFKLEIHKRTKDALKKRIYASLEHDFYLLQDSPIEFG